MQYRRTALSLLTLVVSLANTISDAQVIWSYPRNFERQPLRLEISGSYNVWAWIPGSGAHDVKIDGVTLISRPSGEQLNAYRWSNLGKASLERGDHRLRVGERVAGVALSIDDVFDAQQATQHRRVRAQPERVNDARTERARHTDTVFTMPHFESRSDWEQYAQGLRKRILLSSGLWPLPHRTPLNASISEPIVRDDYSVAKVYFEAHPGFYVTGNLYRPVGQGDGPFPAILCPHGHWGEGRLEDSETGSVPGRAISFARRGIVCLSIDMVGYVDSCQFEHRWSSSREKLWGLHPFALQLWSGIRALDFLEALPDVDAQRLGCTGASGGGTQTFALMAVDSRVSAAAPVNMISSRMQGGCICENAPILRLGNSNMEIAALMAPRPLLMVSATGDWTRETPRVEYPGIKSIYDLYEVPHRVRNVHVDAGHNYNRTSREAAYAFFAEWFLEDRTMSAKEKIFDVEPKDRLRVFPDEDLPPGSPSDQTLKREIMHAVEAKWAEELPRSQADSPEFKAKHAGVLEEVLGVRSPSFSELRMERVGVSELDAYVLERWVLGRTATGDRIPALLYRSYSGTPQDAVLLVHGEGKAALSGMDGGPGPLVTELLSQDKAVLLIDPFLTGEHHTPWQSSERRIVGGFDDTFNVTDTGNRIQDILTAAAYLRSRRDISGSIDLVGIERAGVWSLFAAAVDGRFNRVIIDADLFDTESDEAWVDTHYVPCIRAIGDVATAGAFIAPNPLSIMNVGKAFETKEIESSYIGAPAGRLNLFRHGLSDSDIAGALR